VKVFFGVWRHVIWYKVKLFWRWRQYVTTKRPYLYVVTSQIVLAVHCPVWGKHTDPQFAPKFKKIFYTSEEMKLTHFVSNHIDIKTCRFQWARRLRRGPAAARLLGLPVRIAPWAWMAWECFLLSEVSASGRSFVQRSPAESGVSYRSVIVKPRFWGRSGPLGAAKPWWGAISKHIRLFWSQYNGPRSFPCSGFVITFP
jgi:hypothetical protein